jgi:Uma2 family endonuclease
MASAVQFVFEVPPEGMAGLSLQIPNARRADSKWFFDLCLANEQWQFERTPDGEVIVIAPPGGEGGWRETDTITQLAVWARRDGSGLAFGTSTGFQLPNKALRFPDSAWVKRSRLARLTRAQKETFLPLCPDFVIEVRSRTDRLARLRDKMAEYLENGAQLGWLIDPDQRKVHIYRPGKPVKVLSNPVRLSGGPVLPGFVMELADIWEPGI